ncbi:hypothetical protein L914_16557 [Phytophthora nicotianae]|uniref:Piwi domain-containing protein n=1 Tax=Phytophthora nicotianae TaxID=4792 RepID=W2MMX2_PHYNI|nr:hypothetical protein L914_16557 [Phytophthora nicotianae]
MRKIPVEIQCQERSLMLELLQTHKQTHNDSTFFSWDIVEFKALVCLLKYTVMVDENELSADQIEQLTYRLCYCYARCMRSVAIVPPIHYAQLAAEHALGAVTDTATDCSSTSSNMGSAYSLTGLSDKLAGVMYFV